MRLNKALGLVVAVTCGGTVWGCGEGRTQLSPVSPSSLSSAPSRSTPGPGLSQAPRYVDKDGDGYDDGPETPEGSGTTPPPGPIPAPEQGPVPVPLTVNITGTFGPGSFMPNPLQAVVGDAIVWTNADLIAHIIVLDDGTPVGTLAPGQSSTPVVLAAPTMGYHCTLHPTMVGQVTSLPPGDPAQVPSPDPYGSPSAPGGDGYEDGYEDDYYLAPLR
jgi:plastocyanin